MTMKEIDREIESLQKRFENVKGTETEVYTRIVGYHRDVRNWNNGKKEEYFDRKTFSVNDELIRKDQTDHRSTNDDLVKEKSEQYLNFGNADDIASYKLFYSDFCRNCGPVKEFIKGFSLDGEDVNVGSDLGLEIARQYEIMSTPTVLLLDQQKRVVQRASSVDDLKHCFKS